LNYLRNQKKGKEREEREWPRNRTQEISSPRLAKSKEGKLEGNLLHHGKKPVELSKRWPNKERGKFLRERGD